MNKFEIQNAAFFDTLLKFDQGCQPGVFSVRSGLFECQSTDKREKSNRLFSSLLQNYI